MSGLSLRTIVLIFSVPSLSLKLEKNSNILSVNPGPGSSPKILDLTDAIDRTDGIFHYRCGDSILLHVTLALFEEKYQILHHSPYSLSFFINFDRFD